MIVSQLSLVQELFVTGVQVFFLVRFNLELYVIILFESLRISSSPVWMILNWPGKFQVQLDHTI